MSIHESKWGNAESCEILKWLRESRPPALKLSAETGANVGKEEVPWKLCNGMKYKEICGPWGVTDRMKIMLALKVGEVQEEKFFVTLGIWLEMYVIG